MKARIVHTLIAVLATCAFAAGCGTPTNNTTNVTNLTNGVNSSAGTVNSAASNAANTTSDAANPPSLHTTTEQWPSAPKMTIDTAKTYDAVVHTNYGDFTIQLDAKDSPITVNNFVFLAKHNFYHDCTFFRIIKDFMVQTGDPNNNGTGGPGYTIPDELTHQYPFTKGVVAMANSGQPHTGGSQFFICTVDDTKILQPPNNKYTEFGRVVSGMNVVEKIASIPVTNNPQTGELSYPLATAYIKSIDIEVK
ncbi:Peptidyl-prolyl cis-trans isomerase (rotamase)-cyclophilin family [Alicyclobacillus hesperidum]|uniref:Peptidyl-prolyl cis-trans isomerase n=1 Tax=Alicyclobacillus hesperidum TaxID=89784 RepID=A0A1H2RRU3_9BACL|nr:peptidylprolyl isomerase [Alicyclobacillus hesperidum]SDW22015.1 Peptidyl-prolyl cis-trans isomerase (rotamase)-cyclophilin family [Alicyclobacillus hesperidum]